MINHCNKVDRAIHMVAVYNISNEVSKLIPTFCDQNILSLELKRPQIYQ